jgi:hypothetical protein
VDPIFIPFYLGNGKKYNRSVGITDRNVSIINYWFIKLKNKPGNY